VKTNGWLWVLGLAGCGGLPEYAAPKGAVVELTKLDSSDVIAYRQLTRADFRGKRAPLEFAGIADRVGAATCGQVRTTPETAFFMRWRKDSADGAAHHWVEVKQLGFVALMDRRCSWWNDKVAARAPGYVLEHEQIHFALYELGARQLNASVESIKRSMLSEGSSPREVEAHAQRALNDALAEATQQLIDRNRDFDQDTSLGYRPDRQHAWLQKVRSELAETKAFARRH
jgi:hypothetical protein